MFRLCAEPVLVLGFADNVEIAHDTVSLHVRLDCHPTETWNAERVGVIHGWEVAGTFGRLAGGFRVLSDRLDLTLA